MFMNDSYNKTFFVSNKIVTFNDKDPAWATEYLKSKINMHKNILISLENWRKMQFEW